MVKRALLCAVVFVAGFGVCHLTAKPTHRKTAQTGPNWTGEPPTQIIVSRPDGEKRRTHRLQVVRIADSHHSSDLPADKWRVVLVSESGTYFAECDEVGVD